MFYQNGFRNPNMPKKQPQKPNALYLKMTSKVVKTLIQWTLIKLFTLYYLTEYLLPLTSFILTVWNMICTVNS